MCYLYECFQGWPLDLGQPVGVVFPGEDRLSCFQLSYSALCRVEAMWDFPHLFGMPTGALLFASHLSSHVGETLWVLLLMLLGHTISQQTPSPSGSFNLSAPSSAMFPEPQVWRFLIAVFIETWLLKYAFWLAVAFCGGLPSVAKRGFLDVFLNCFINNSKNSERRPDFSTHI